MNIRQHIKQQHAVTTLAGVFALVSVQNVSHFFISLGHPDAASWTLGIAIGTALVILAHLLSEIDMRERKAFAGLLTVTLILVTLSGLIQGSEYSHKLGHMGYLLAFVLAATGEIVLPLAHSWHSEAMRRRIVNDAGQRVEEIAAQTLVDTMSGVDVTRAQRQAEKRIEQLVIAHVDSIVRKLMPDTRGIEAQPEPTPTVALSANAEPGAPNADFDTGFGPHNLPEANRQRAADADQRRSALLDLLRSMDGMEAEAVNRSELARQLGSSARTIGRDLEALEAEGAIALNGVVAVVAA